MTRTYRDSQQIKLQILNYLLDNGPSGTTEIMYSVEINTVQMNRIRRELAAANLIRTEDRRNLDPRLPPKKDADLYGRIYHNATRLMVLTDEGKKCLQLMKKRNQMIDIVPL